MSAEQAYREIVRGEDCGKVFFAALSAPDNDEAAMLTMGGEMY